MLEGFKPLLSGKVRADELEKLPFPLIASPKLDGIRCIVHGGRAYSRYLNLLPNKHVQSMFWEKLSKKVMLDGEIVAGNALDPNAFNQTQSDILSIDGKPKFTFWVFDDPSKPDEEFHWRLHQANMYVREARLPFLKLLEHKHIKTLEELIEYEAKHVDLGFEGVMVRSPNGRYKHGRSTFREGILIKIKRFEDSEAEVLDSYELMHNANEATIDNLGQQKRSHHKAGKIGKDMLGGFSVRDIHTGVEFDVGSGFTEAQRHEFWADRKGMKGRIFTYRFQPAGVKEKPRFPVFKGFRPEHGN